MTYTFSREQIVKQLELSHETYSKWYEMLKSRTLSSEQTKHDIAYCEGIMAGMSSALTYLKHQVPTVLF